MPAAYPYYSGRPKADTNDTLPPERELNAEEKAQAIREKAKLLNSSLCLVLNKLAPAGEGVAPIIELGFDAPGSIIKKAITQLKETAKLFEEEKKVENFEEAMRALQNDWVSGKPIDVEVAYQLVKTLQKSIEVKDDSIDAAKLNQQLNTLPAKIDQEIERLEENAHRRVSDQASTEAYKKLVQEAGDEWIKKLPYPSDDPGEVTVREEEQNRLGEDTARKNAIARLVNRNDEDIAFNYVDSLACSISRRKDKTGSTVFKVQYVDNNPKNVKQAMEKMILRCHELNPLSEIILSCTPLKDIYGDPKKYMGMRLKELEALVQVAEEAKATGKHIGLVLDSSLKQLLDQMPEDRNLMARISNLHKEWVENVQTKNEKIKQEAVARYNREEGGLWKLLANAPVHNALPPNTSAEQLTNEVKRLNSKYSHLFMLMQSVGQSLKKIEDHKADEDGLERRLEELNHLRIIQGKLSKELENFSRNAGNFVSWFELDLVKGIYIPAPGELLPIKDEIKDVMTKTRLLIVEMDKNSPYIDQLLHEVQQHREAVRQNQMLSL
jgi:hypothetical protein